MYRFIGLNGYSNCLCVNGSSFEFQPDAIYDNSVFVLHFPQRFAKVEIEDQELDQDIEDNKEDLEISEIEEQETVVKEISDFDKKKQNKKSKK